MNSADYEAVSHAETREEFREALSSIAAKMGFPLVNALLVNGQFDSPDLRIGAIGNTPSSFLMTHADLARIRTDPVMHRLMNAPTPFVWNQDFYVRANRGHLWEDQAPHGYRVGVAASVQVIPGQHVFVGVDRHEKLPTSGSQLAQLQANLQMLAVHSLVAGRRLLQQHVDRPKQVMQLPTLSARELQVLRWTREGKSAGVIAQILEIKERTVVGYLKIAMDKLGVQGSKHKAVLLATSLGLI